MKAVKFKKIIKKKREKEKVRVRVSLKKDM